MPSDIVENHEVEEIMAILESLEDEHLAVVLLKEFNDKTKALGKLLLNQDPNLDHEEWKQECDQAKKEVDNIVEKIKRL